eukprot:1119809-Pelagomonas_calceolata.AAC.3
MEWKGSVVGHRIAAIFIRENPVQGVPKRILESDANYKNMSLGVKYGPRVELQAILGDESFAGLEVGITYIYEFKGPFWGGRVLHERGPNYSPTTPTFLLQGQKPFTLPREKFTGWDNVTLSQP